MNSAAPLFSVCVPAWQNSATLPAALASVLAQSKADWECLVSDDGSTDNTRESIRGFLVDPRIHYHCNPQNLGQAANWAGVIGRCRGQFITTLHADDAYEPTALVTFLEGFERGAELVWANWEYWDGALDKPIRSAPVGDAEFQGLQAFDWLVANNHTLPSATAFRADLASRMGLPDPDCGIFCDREYFLRLAAGARSAMAVGSSVVRYRQHAQSTTSDSFLSGTFQCDMLRLARVLDRKFSANPATLRHVAELRRQSAEAVFVSAADALLVGKPGVALAWMRDAWALGKFALIRPSLFLGLARRVKARMLTR